MQLRVLQKEEELQKKKKKLLEVEMRRALVEEEVALLKKGKLELEIAKLSAHSSQVVPQVIDDPDQLQLVNSLLNQQ